MPPAFAYTHRTAREIMADPKIKALIDSIRYEPDVCEKILNGN